MILLGVSQFMVSAMWFCCLFQIRPCAILSSSQSTRPLVQTANRVAQIASILGPQVLNSDTPYCGNPRSQFWSQNSCPGVELTDLRPNLTVSGAQGLTSPDIAHGLCEYCTSYTRNSRLVICDPHVWALVLHLVEAVVRQLWLRNEAVAGVPSHRTMVRRVYTPINVIIRCRG